MYIIVFLTFLSCCRIYGQAEEVFSCIELGIVFTSNSDWTFPGYGGSGVFNIENINHNMTLKAWYEESGLTAVECLNEIMEREGMCNLIRPFTTMVDQQDATAVIAGFHKMRKPYRILLLAVKRKEGYNIITFTCPDACFRDQSRKLKELIGSIEFIPAEEGYMYYTGYWKTS